MEKFRISATLVTLHLFKQAIWEDTWKLTFEKITHMQLMWLCICSIRRFEKTFENHLMEKFRISATLVTLHLFKQAFWEDTWKLTFEKTTHMQLIWLCICSIKRFEWTFENHLMEKFRISATVVTLHLFKQAIWEDVWKSFSGKISHIYNYCDFLSNQAGDLKTHENSYLRN